MYYGLMAFACFMNALVCCGLIQLLLRRFVKSDWRYVITYIMYVMLAFIMVTPGEGILKVNFAELDLTRFVLYLLGGACVCVMLYITHRAKMKNIEKYGEAAMTKSKKKS